MECSQMRVVAAGFKGRGGGTEPCKMHTCRAGTRRNGALRLDAAALCPNA